MVGWLLIGIDCFVISSGRIQQDYASRSRICMGVIERKQTFVLYR